jgi:nucleoside-diphosphate-sugar epimerase
MGCGWLGLPLAEILLEKCFAVNGSTTSKDKLDSLKKQRIKPFLIGLLDEGIEGDIENFLKDSETLIINIPPGLRKNPNKNHVKEIRYLIEAIERSKVNNVLYISSTSVFKDEITFPVITEATIPNDLSKTGKQLISIENLLVQNSNFNTTILRFGGLIDNNRHPGKVLSGRTDVPNPEAPINLIHKTDAINIILTILEKDAWQTTFNAVYPLHPDKKTYYSSYCEAHNLPRPFFDYSKKSNGKIVESLKLERLLNYKYVVKP